MVAACRSRIRFPRHAVQGYSPRTVAAAYQFPAGFSGKGCTIGVIELGGQYSAADMATFCQSEGVPVPRVVCVNVAGGSQQSDPGGANVEVMLDVEVCAAVAPGATLRVYFAPNTDQGFGAAIQQAQADGCNVLSISWGGPEDQWPAQSRAMLDQALAACVQAGIPVFVAAGDNGSGDGESGQHVDFPSSSPFATACGGTRAVIANGAVQSEVVWNDGNQGGATGGGVSVYEGLPAYQAGVGVPGKGRGVPDLAGNADPVTGYRIVADGQVGVVGGTSAVAPLMAALYALLWEATGGKVGAWPAPLYSLPKECFRDIVSGNNGTYAAKPGWDATTGLGVPVGAQILAALQGASPPPPPPPPPPGPGPTDPLTGYISMPQAEQCFAQAASQGGFLQRLEIEAAARVVLPLMQQVAARN